MKRETTLIFIVFVSLLFANRAVAQKSDSIKYKNNIKYNFTAPILWGVKNYVFEYERILSSNRSINIGLGYRSFPKMINIGKSDSAFIVRDHENKGGFSASADYRFYLTKENRYLAPRGIYLSPHIYYFNTKFENTLSTFYSDIASVNILTKVDVLSVGGQLGYQFVFFERLSLDLCLIGPSVSWYNINMKIDGSLDVKNIDEDMAEIILDNFPILNMFYEEYEFDKRGRVSSFGYGFRYYFKVGFLF